MELEADNTLHEWVWWLDPYEGEEEVDPGPLMNDSTVLLRPSLHPTRSVTENLVLSSLQRILGPGQILELFKNFGQDQRNRGQNDEIFDNTMG